MQNFLSILNPQTNHIHESWFKRLFFQSISGLVRGWGWNIEELNSQASTLTDAIYEADYIMNSNFNKPEIQWTHPQKWAKRIIRFTLEIPGKRNGYKILVLFLQMTCKHSKNTLNLKTLQEKRSFLKIWLFLVTIKPNWLNEFRRTHHSLLGLVGWIYFVNFLFMQIYCPLSLKHLMLTRFTCLSVFYSSIK